MFIDSIKIFFKNIKIIIPTLVLSLLFSIPSLFFNENLYSNETDVADPNALAPYVFGILGLLLLLFVVIIAISILFECWNVYMCSLASKGETFTLFGSLKKSLKYFWRILGVFAIQFAIAFAFLIVFSLVFGMFFISISISPSSSIAMPIVLGIILFLVGIFFYITLLPIIYVIVNDDVGVGSGFSIGFKFGLKKFFHILASFIPIVICTIIYIVISYPTLDQATTFTIADIIFQIVAAALGMIIGIYILKLYNASKESSKEVLVEAPTIDETNSSYDEE